MPNLNGYELLRSAKHAAPLDLRIILLSGLGNQGERRDIIKPTYTLKTSLTEVLIDALKS